MLPLHTTNGLDSSDIDVHLEVLSKHERRSILRELQDNDIIGIPDFVEFSGIPNERVETELTHNHLPRLDAEGYIDWDRNMGEIKRGARYDEIEPILELLEPLLED